MPAVKCLGCGRTTNTAICDWIDCPENKGLSTPAYASKCYAAYVNEEWVEGCAYGKDPLNKALADHLLGRDTTNKIKKRKVKK